jgi:hypothetical protein
MVEIAQNNESEQKKKDDIKAKKEALKKEQEKDALNKQVFRDKINQKVNINDFNDNNVLSYVYETKLHKSYEYDKKKEANISKIMINFPKEDKIELYHNRKENGINPTDGPTKEAQAKRKAD